MESLTYCQANSTRVAVKTVRRDTAGSGMESLTYCQANRTRVAVRTVRWDTAGSGMESLTCYQANRARAAVRTVRRNTAQDLGITHKLSSEQHQSCIHKKVTASLNMNY